MGSFFYAVKALRQRGIGFIWTYFSESVWFDLRHGTTTFARVPKHEQTIDSDEAQAENGLLYVASFTSVTRKTVEIARRVIGADRFPDAQFVDLGCGKGKALLVYAQQYGADQKHPALGIEYDPDLSVLARQNVAKCDFAKGRVNIVTDSALNLRSHISSDVLVVYIYNSFQGDTLLSVLKVLEEIPHVLIYVDPADRGALAQFGYSIVEEAAGRYNADTWLIASGGGLQGAQQNG